MNSGAIDDTALYWAERRVLDHQRKLHRWARAEPDKRFGDLFNLICDQATLLMAWSRVAGNRGARTAGVDAVTRRHVEEDIGVLPFLEELRSSLRDGTFTALPVRQVAIPKKSGKLRLLGIPTLRDRVAQMALKLILEPIFEVDFYPSSYGYRPARRAQDAITEIHQLTSRSYEWVVEGDITACLDASSHCCSSLRIHTSASLKARTSIPRSRRLLSSPRSESRWSPRSAARRTDLDSRRATTRIRREEWPLIVGIVSDV